MWRVKKNEDREQWAWSPLVAVGPLEFGMRSDEVAEAFGERTIGGGERREGHEHFQDRGVMAYYTDAGHLAAVGLSAATGPQLTLGGIPLVGQPVEQARSQTVQRLLGYAEEQGLRFSWLPSGDPALQQLGLVVRRVQVGDAVLSRPLLMYSGWSWGGMWEEFIPGQEWMTSP
ncbi:hypothetical protein ACFCXF_33860 [Streptomyces virginiae]|uniref:hypothetical protein n=1 Tax=Streptomyces virginiae TaxID=1961 RepID=UPI00068AB4C5|nr:hypothetical protein [Streptomyces virginiae]